MNSHRNKLFLHFGPGGNPLIDKEIISDDSVHFWHQPGYNNHESYISFLIKSTEDEIKRMHEACGEQVDLIAHSFGAFIAMNLNQSTKQLIKKYTFIAPTFSFQDAIVNLVSRVSSHESQYNILETVDNFKNDQTPEKFWEMFQAFSTKYPDYLKFYWSLEENYSKYLTLCTKYPELDESTLVRATNELILGHKKLLLDYDRIDSETLVYLGEFDPLVSEEQIKEIKFFFGDKAVQILATGHFPHLETKIIF